MPQQLIGPGGRIVLGTPVGSALTSRPNDGTGYWPDFSNTGFYHTPANVAGLGNAAYSGTITDYRTGMTPTTTCFIAGGGLTDGGTATFKRFLGNNTYNGNTPPSIGYNFVGCIFEGTQPQGNLVQLYSAGTVHYNFYYCTFRPYNVGTPHPSYPGVMLPPGNNGSVSSANGVASLGTDYAAGAQISVSQAGANIAVFKFYNCEFWGGSATHPGDGASTIDPTLYNFCYLHDMADPWCYYYFTENPGEISGGVPIAGSKHLHHDGVGNFTSPATDMTVNFCTIASMGNTNGIAYQGVSSHSNITVTSCYCAGFGEFFSMGAAVPDNNTNIIVTDNIFSGELACVNDNAAYGSTHPGPLTPSGGVGPNHVTQQTPLVPAYLQTAGSLWRRNRFQMRVGDSTVAEGGFTVANNGQFWLPGGIASVTDYTG